LIINASDRNLEKASFNGPKFTSSRAPRIRCRRRILHDRSRGRGFGRLKGAAPAGFSSAEASVNETSLHYVRDGRGSAVILFHGFPEDWVEYRAVMPRLAQRFTVVAVDLPGTGRSAPAAGCYDAQSSSVFQM